VAWWTQRLELEPEGEAWIIKTNSRIKFRFFFGFFCVFLSVCFLSISLPYPSSDFFYTSPCKLRRQDLAAEMFDFCCQPSKQPTLMVMNAGSSTKVMMKVGSIHIYTRSIDMAWWYCCHIKVENYHGRNMAAFHGSAVLLAGSDSVYI
jgi:hypothetical protein